MAASLGTDLSLTDLYFDSAILTLDSAFSSARSTFVTCDPAALGAVACAEKVIREVGLKAFRRPVRPAEVAQFMALYNSNRARFPASATTVSAFDESLKASLHGILISPQFIYRVVEMPSSGPAAVKTLDPYEVASRLSFFLWAVHPDRALFDLAATGSLLSSATLTGQVERMLKDARAKHLVDNFAQQWLKLENLPRAHPDSTVYPEFTGPLRQAMATESKMLLANVFQGDASPYLLLNADYTYLNNALSTLYRIGNVTSSMFSKVSLAGTGRAGLVTHASLLTVNARPTESSIVQRGLWALDRILCVAIGSPPPETPELPASEPSITNPRKSLQDHASKPACAGCHNQIDPAGFGLENFDGIGKWRTSYRNGDPIDASGRFPGGAEFRGGKELADVLAQNPRFPSCFAEHFMTFALGRVMSEGDWCAVEAIAQSSVTPSGKFSDIVKRVVLSKQFLSQDGGN